VGKFVLIKGTRIEGIYDTYADARRLDTRYKRFRLEPFPPAVARITTTPLYNWPDVAKWLYRPHRLQKDAVVEALAMKASNTILGVPDFGRALKERLKAEESRLENANV